MKVYDNDITYTSITARCNVLLSLHIAHKNSVFAELRIAGSALDPVS